VLLASRSKENKFSVEPSLGILLAPQGTFYARGKFGRQLVSAAVLFVRCSLRFFSTFFFELAAMNGRFLLLCFAACVLFPGLAHSADLRPNIILIVADDFGFGDLGVHGCKDIATPHLDALAAGGVRCTQGYMSAPQCSPMRAGLLTGRYQQRFGHETNQSIADSALDLNEVTIATRLKQAGYKTGLVGKWHLGSDAEHVPQQRGFDEFFGFLGGANPYLPKAPTYTVPRILRGSISKANEDAREKEYLTTAFGREAVSFVNRHREHPFFLYLAFNATHGPLEATEQDLAKFAHIADEKRRTYAAMLTAMDEQVGRVLQTVRDSQLEERTIIVFVADNGGPTAVNGSSNAPYRGVKGETREGGIRSPYFVQWKGTLTPGKTYDSPVSTLDLFPTFTAAAGITEPSKKPLDGVDLLPYLKGEKQGDAHETLYWRFSFPPNQPERYKWAIRRGNWKLVTDIGGNRSKDNREVKDGNVILVDLSKDPTESRDLSAEQPAKREELLAAWKKWNAELPPPPSERAKDPETPNKKAAARREAKAAAKE
jgi:arylsulfatase A-like enzyme